MSVDAISAKPRGLALALDWRRLRFTLLFSGVLGLLLGIGAHSGPLVVIGRAVLLGLVAMLVFGLLEQWPRRLPAWLARWALQVGGVALVIVPSSAMIFWLTNDPGAPAFFQVPGRMQDFSKLTMLALFLAPWVALSALVRQKEALARHQALTFDLERSELERRALDARLRLLQTQVAPHFLFNTLANVQALVDAGSPQAPAVLRSLVAYLRAAVPRLDDSAGTIDRELQLVRAYLELMQMRMPDRLQYAVHADAEAHRLVCPPMTLLTLVENAVRHGIDPSEEGGRIDLHVQRRGDRCRVRIDDTGAGLRADPRGPGTGLATLRERLRLTFGGDVELRVVSREPRGVTAELEFPARETVSE